MTYQIHAQLFLSQEDSNNALIYFNKALDLEAMKAVQAVSLATNVAQLYLSDSKIAEAISVWKKGRYFQKNGTLLIFVFSKLLSFVVLLTVQFDIASHVGFLTS